MSLHRRALAIGGLLAIAGTVRVESADRLRFWNLTQNTITQLYLAPAGTTDWGANQCANDPDGSVSPDERLLLKDVGTGRYDVRFVDATGRSCVVRGVTLQAGKAYAFSIAETELTDCTKGRHP